MALPSAGYGGGDKGGSAASNASVAGTDTSLVGKRLRLYVESGGLLGRETVDGIDYGSLPVRFFAATGFKIMLFPRDSLPRPLESAGFEYTMAIGHGGGHGWEARHAVGPAITWRLNEDWRLHNMAGIVWSSKRRIIDRGFQFRNNVSYKNVVSLEFIYQGLPGVSRDERSGIGSVDSWYTGFVLHGKPGGYLLIGAGAVTIIGGIVAAYALVQGLSSL
jgi:hypothetical protein